ncbi:MAG: nuclear transport factor 2 family protein [Burkholderiaceae bacterium]|nr:nuclear transport factor 2 family protein [Burkholderiaceae bacterium]
MQPPQVILEKLYTAFARLDAATMAECYTQDAQFDDEVFSLRGQAEVAGMWSMLCEATRSKGADVWKLQHSDVQADTRAGSAHWVADYRFSATGRMVRNRIDSRFTFDAAGLIATQRDRFNFWRWARQALGLPGLLLGWTPWLRNKVRRQAATNLRRYLQR